MGRRGGEKRWGGEVGRRGGEEGLVSGGFDSFQLFEVEQIGTDPCLNQFLEKSKIMDHKREGEGREGRGRGER